MDLHNRRPPHNPGRHNWPETATFLTPSERALLLKRLSLDVGEARMDVLNRRAARRVFTDWKIWCGVLMYTGVVNSGYATSFFVPTIIQEMGYTAAMSQVRSIPIFIVAAVAALAVAWATDRMKHRYAFTIAGVVVGGIGYVMLLCQEDVSVGVKYIACFFITTGGYMTQPVTWVVWIPGSLYPLSFYSIYSILLWKHRLVSCSLETRRRSLLCP
jgi:hypothetical protein